MEQSQYLCLVDDKIYLYNREDVLAFDIIQNSDPVNDYRIFELQKGIMRNYYSEIKIGDAK